MADIGVNSGERVALNLSSSIVAGEQVAVDDDKESTTVPSPAPTTAPNTSASLTEAEAMATAHIAAAESDIRSLAPASAPGK